MLPLLHVSFQGMLKNPHTSRKEKETKLPVLWSDLVIVYTGPHFNQLWAELSQPVYISQLQT